MIFEKFVALAKKFALARKANDQKPMTNDCNFVGDLTAGVPPVPIPNTEVKPRRADCTARESVWESRSLPALIKASLRNQIGLFLFCAFVISTRERSEAGGMEESAVYFLPRSMAAITRGLRRACSTAITASGFSSGA